MSAETKLFDNLIHLIKMQIHTFVPARVVSFNQTTQQANIEVLFMSRDKNGNTSTVPMIEDVPVLGMRYRAVGSHTAVVNGLQGVHGGVDGTAAVITPTQEIEYRPFLKSGDIVFCGISERSLDNLQSAPFDPEARRMFNIRDCVVLGMVTL